MCGGNHHVARAVSRATPSHAGRAMDILTSCAGRMTGARWPGDCAMDGRWIAHVSAAGCRMLACCPRALVAREAATGRALVAQIAPPVVAPLHSILHAMAGRRGAVGRRLLGAGCAMMHAGRAMGARRCARPRVALGVALCAAAASFFVVSRRSGQAPAMS
ncbi:phospholipid-transporting ATPase 9-like [Dorcoceras hygrometricum]|uniref:Phospholipid-transporting ATPase 9-like n=1 Tax=Dorcoceras hygrometricum TaxID=472368 RepID=A0A2Z7A499_9LAMI|nr:phospholipid-transporting ATPase 9-like [Dorcoceras hygrometricum]